MGNDLPHQDPPVNNQSNDEANQNNGFTRLLPGLWQPGTV